MAINVLVVDDSSFFRRRVSEIINADPRLKVIDVATNGQEAIDKVKTLRPDVVTMDIEMPVLDGISAVREIMASVPTPILMFSSLTHEGATATLEALDAGALDFIPKKFEDIARNREEAIALLQTRVVNLVGKSGHATRLQRPVMQTKPTSLNSYTSSNSMATRAEASPLTSHRAVKSTPLTSHRVTPSPKKMSDRENQSSASGFVSSGKRYQLTAIGTSTGGPVALQTILTQLPKNYPHPILLIQLMPATFTAAFAARLNSLCQINVKESCDGDLLRAGTAYLAPGGMQMMVDGRTGQARLSILDGGDRMNYKPSVDVTFGSAAKVFQDKVLSLVLTGMGADGREGARMLKKCASTVWAQDEKSCVVYGMPQAIKMQD